MLLLPAVEDKEVDMEDVGEVDASDGVVIPGSFCSIVSLEPVGCNKVNGNIFLFFTGLEYVRGLC